MLKYYTNESGGIEMLPNEVWRTGFYFSLDWLSFIKDIKENFEFVFSLGLFPSFVNMVGDLITN